jgi:hypothetical protein
MNKIKKLSKTLEGMGLRYEAAEILKLAEASMPSNDMNNITNDLRRLFDGTRLKEIFVPQKIISVPQDITSFFSSNGRGDVKFTSNGAIRELKETLQGGPARDKGSLHGLGLAHDLIIDTPKLSGSYNIGRNSEVIQKDPELVSLMSKFAEQAGLVWGGKMSRGKSFDVNGTQVYDMELHHFELPKSELISSVHPDIINFMNKVGLSESSIFSSSGRQELYSQLVNALSGGPVEVIDRSRSDSISANDEQSSFEENAPTGLGEMDLRTAISIGRLFGIT